MSWQSTEALDARYKNSFGWLAGYLPEDRSGIDNWLKDLRSNAKQALTPGKITFRNESVRALSELIYSDGIVRMYVTEMINQVPDAHKTIDSIDELLYTLDVICKTAPAYNADKSKRVLFPMSALFVYMMATPAGKAAFRNDAFNEALRNILKTWCDYLDSPASLSVINYDNVTGWLGDAAKVEFKLDQFVIEWGATHGGFQSYNDFFHREIKSDKRPIAGVGDPSVIVSANDGTVYKIAADVQPYTEFWIKEKCYSLADMVNYDSELVKRFTGGTVIQVFLSGADYHRWHAPVDGLVHVENVNGLLFSENDDTAFDPDAGVASQVYGAAVNNRGLIFIEAKDTRLGVVGIIPIGITEISSITTTARPGSHVTKGEELGYFSYGGSTLCLLFQKNVVKSFTKQVKETIEVNAQIATANF